MTLSLLELKSTAALILLAITLIAGYYPFHKRHNTTHELELPWAEAFTSGVFLGAGLLHMLSDANQRFLATGHNYPWAFLIVGITFLALYILEETARYYQRHQTMQQALFAVIATLMLAIHSLLEGTALGLSSNLWMAVLIFIAIFAHKWAAGFALAVQINKTGLGLLNRASLFIAFALMTPLGIVLGDWIHHHTATNTLIEPIFTAMAAGTFIYLGTLHHIGHRCSSPKQTLPRYFFFMVSGFALMALVAIWT